MYFSVTKLSELKYAISNRFWTFCWRVRRLIITEIRSVGRDIDPLVCKLLVYVYLQLQLVRI